MLNWLIKFVETLWLLIGFVYFVDVQTDGDLDLPHQMLILNKRSRLYRFLVKVVEIVKARLL
ncbi:MAG: hypothetical protein HWN68_08285 [Desulfobacterales bacterium]|nr:hypothetical protein [Desulfobacterales bacterium]